jgi:hypothetical protein
VPHMIIYHYIPPERLTKSYFRRWCFWRGVSCGLIDRERRMPVVYLGGIPRYLYGQLARGLLGTVKGQLSRGRDLSRTFNDELSAWDAAGFFYGKHFFRTSGSQQPHKQSGQDTGTVELRGLNNHEAQQACSRSPE